MNCWEILGITKTDNWHEIKKAYAKKVEELTTESTAKDFEKLKTAFDEAAVQSSASAGNAAQSDLLDGLIEANQLTHVEPDAPIEEDQTKSKLQLAIERVKRESTRSFGENFAELLNQRAYFDDVNVWQDLTAAVANQDAAKVLEAKTLLAKFLAINFALVSKKVRTHLLEFCQSDDVANPLVVKAVVGVINAYPDLDFSFWHAIDKKQRENYFAGRDQVHQLISSQAPVTDLKKKVSDCLTIYGEDPVLNLLAADVLILIDFRMENATCSTQLQLLLEKGSDNPHWNYLKQYVAFVKKAKASNEKNSNETAAKGVEFLSTAADDIPPAVFSLTQGYAAYLAENKKLAAKHFDHYEKTYRNVLTEKERKFIDGTQAAPTKTATQTTAQTATPKAAAPEEEKQTNYRPVVIGILAIVVLAILWKVLL